jgi:predicted transcriptional regulator
VGAKGLLDGYTKRRDQLSIIATILDKASEGARKTQIMYAANLSFTQLNEYITFLLDQGLMRQHKVDKKEIYIATVRGVLFVQMYAELLDMIKTQPKLYQKQPLVTELV